MSSAVKTTGIRCDLVKSSTPHHARLWSPLMEDWILFKCELKRLEGFTRGRGDKPNGCLRNETSVISALEAEAGGSGIGGQRGLHRKTLLQ